MSTERDELARMAYVAAASPRSEADASSDWDYVQSHVLQAKERIFAEQYRVADAVLAAGYRKPQQVTTTDKLNAMNGTEWPSAVGEIWESNRSRFSTAWEDLSQHDQVAVYRILTREEAA